MVDRSNHARYESVVARFMPALVASPHPGGILAQLSDLTQAYIRGVGSPEAYHVLN